MPYHSTTISLKPAHDANAPPPPTRRMRRSSIAPSDSLLAQPASRPSRAQPASRPSRAQRKAKQLAEALASSSPLPPPPQLRDVDALVRTPGKEKKQKKKPKSSRRARDAPAEKKTAAPRRTSREIEDLVARLELLPTSSPLPARPQIRSEEELAVAAEELRKEKAAAAAEEEKAARRLRPALADKSRNVPTEGKKVLRVQTKAQRIELGARGRAVAAELERRKAVPATPPRPRRRLLEESPLTPSPSSSFDFDVD